MKKIVILFSFLFVLSVCNVSAGGKKDKHAKNMAEQIANSQGEDVKSETSKYTFSVTDPEYEWSQTDSKKIKVQLKGEGIEFESKEDDGTAFSIVELPINVEDDTDFMFGVVLAGPKLDEKKSLGLIFDYENARNYKGISIYKKQYDYFVVKDGVVSSVKTGLVKMKDNVYVLTMSRENGKVEFKLNDLEICTLKKIAMTNSMFGAFIHGKMKAYMSSFIMKNQLPEDSEQSTSDV